jgi:hypothetical protein
VVPHFAAPMITRFGSIESALLRSKNAGSRVVLAE